MGAGPKKNREPKESAFLSEQPSRSTVHKLSIHSAGWSSFKVCIAVRFFFPRVVLNSFFGQFFFFLLDYQLDSLGLI